MEDLYETLDQLLTDTAEAHHEAFSATEGEDANWPLWYADHLKDKLENLLNATFSKSELVYLLLKLHYDQQANAPGGQWSRYYASYLAETYGG